MIYFVEDFFQMAYDLNITYLRFCDDKRNELWHEFLNKFCCNYQFVDRKINYQIPLLCYFNPEKTEAFSFPTISMKRELFLNKIPCNQRPCYFMFDREYDNSIYQFKNYRDLNQVLNNSYSFHFHIFSFESNYLISWDYDDERLLAQGISIPWIRDIEKYWNEFYQSKEWREFYYSHSNKSEDDD